MRLQTRTVTVVTLEATEAEWAAVRQLVAEGLSVVDTVTPRMRQVADALGLRVADAGALSDATPPVEERPAPDDRAPTPRARRARSKGG